MADPATQPTTSYDVYTVEQFKKLSEYQDNKSAVFTRTSLPDPTTKPSPTGLDEQMKGDADTRIVILKDNDQPVSIMIGKIVQEGSANEDFILASTAQFNLKHKTALLPEDLKKGATNLGIHLPGDAVHDHTKEKGYRKESALPADKRFQFAETSSDTIAPPISAALAKSLAKTQVG